MLIVPCRRRASTRGFHPRASAARHTYCGGKKSTPHRAKRGSFLPPQYAVQLKREFSPHQIRLTGKSSWLHQGLARATRLNTHIQAKRTVQAAQPNTAAQTRVRVHLSTINQRKCFAHLFHAVPCHGSIPAAAPQNCVRQISIRKISRRKKQNPANPQKGYLNPLENTLQEKNNSYGAGLQVAFKPYGLWNSF